MYVCIIWYLYKLVSIQACMDLCMHLRTYVCMYACSMYACIYVGVYVGCIYACIYVCMYAYMYVCMYIHIHLYIPSSLGVMFLLPRNVSSSSESLSFIKSRPRRLIFTRLSLTWTSLISSIVLWGPYCNWISRGDSDLPIVRTSEKEIKKIKSHPTFIYL